MFQESVSSSGSAHLPAASPDTGAPESASTAAPAQQPVAGPGLRRVLVVEDNPDGLETLMALLAMLGHEVEGAADGGDALERAGSFLPDVVLLDLGLPVMDGFEVARRLRQDPRMVGVVIAALTGWGSDGDRQRTAEAGFDAHLTKPVELAALETVLARSSGRTDR